MPVVLSAAACPEEAQATNGKDLLFAAVEKQFLRLRLGTMVTIAALFTGMLLTQPAPLAAQSGVSPPVWVKPDNFWYRHAVPGGHEWVMVDAQFAVKEPLFDHKRLAIELTIRTGVEYTPLTLPLVAPEARFVVKFDGSNAYIAEGAKAIEFTLDGEHWRCDLQIKWNWNLVPPTDYECKSRGLPMETDALPPDTAARISPDGMWAATIENHNVVAREVGGARRIPLSTDGSAAFPYHLGSITWSDDSDAVIAYRVKPEVWLREDPRADLKSMIARGSWPVR